MACYHITLGPSDRDFYDPISDMEISDWILPYSGWSLLLILDEVINESFCLTINTKTLGVLFHDISEN